MNYKTQKDLEGSDQGQKHYHFKFLSLKGANKRQYLKFRCI